MRARTQKLSSPLTSPALMSLGTLKLTTPERVKARVSSLKFHSLTASCVLTTPLMVDLPRMRHFFSSKYSHEISRSSDGVGGGMNVGSESANSIRTSASAVESSSREAM